MQRLGLTHAEYRLFLRELVNPGQQRRIVVDVLDLDGNLKTSLTPDFTDGQVIVDTTTGVDEPARKLDLRFLDPSRSIHFEPDSPGDAPLHRKRMVQVTVSVRVPALDRWVDCEVFTGPIWKFDREGALVSIVAHGLERQAMGAKWSPQTFKKGRKKTDALKELAADAGENRLGGIPDLPAKMPERMTITRLDTIWPRMQRLARSMDRQLFYNGAGRLILRRLPSRPVFTFDARHLLTDVVIQRDPEGVHNTFIAVGSKAKGAKKRPQAVEHLPNAHPLSSDALARNGVRHRLVRREENRQIKTNAEAKARAARMRDDASRVLVDYQFDSVPVPHLDELDLVRVRTDEGTFQVRMKRWTYPLGWEGAPPMTVGSIKRTTKARPGRRAGRG